MRRQNIDRCHKEGYKWMRFQESKLLTCIFISLLFAAILPFHIDGLVSQNSHIGIVLILGFFSKYIFTEYSIVTEDDGIFLEINKRKYIKLLDWNEKDFRFNTTVDKVFSFKINKRILSVEKHGFNYSVHQPLCNSMHIFFQSVCDELLEVHYRKLQKHLF